MTRYVPEGTVEVHLLTTATAGAPTTAQLNAGTDITASLVGDLNLPFEGSAVDAADMSSKFNATVDGDFGGQPGTFTIQKEKAYASDTTFIALPRGTTGYLAVANRGLQTPGTWAINDYVDLIPITVLSRTTQFGRGASMKAAIQVAITAVPLEDYKVLS